MQIMGILSLARVMVDWTASEMVHILDLNAPVEPSEDMDKPGNVFFNHGNQ
jgi:hypothetical protein